MFNAGYSQTGVGRYFQYHGALNKVGQELSHFARSVLVVYADDVVYHKTETRIVQSIMDTDLEYHLLVLPGPATAANFALVAEKVRELGAGAVLGVGGGRVLDIVKAAGERAGVPIFTAPTSAATCAAFAVLYVEYNEDGSIASNSFLQREISGVFVDLDYVLEDCPVRYFVAGIADALSKLPEFRFTSQCLGGEGQTAPVAAAVALARYSHGEYMAKALQAKRDFEAGEDFPLLDDFVSLNIQIIGLISDLSTGGKSYMVAHNFYDAICRLHPQIRQSFLHGELVGLALPVQMHVLGDDPDEVETLLAFLRALGVPASLPEIGFPEGEESFEELVQYIYRVTGVHTPQMETLLRDGLGYLR